MCPIDFGVKRSTVKVMAHGYLKMVHRNNGCRFEFVGVGGGPVLLQQYFQYAFICCPYMLPLLLHHKIICPLFPWATSYDRITELGIVSLRNVACHL